jgi:undecaprenyl diphosphate synthase
LSSSTVPQHVGIIMDGNGRWARSRNLPRTAGHREGLSTAKSVVKAAHDIGIRFLSLYTFSTENWKRTAEEVSFLMGLIKSNIRKEYEFYKENDVRVVHSGDLGALPPEIRREIEDVEGDTAGFSGITVNLAINYGGRNEIIRAVQAASRAGASPEDLDETALTAHLDRPELPDLDLIIRTGGEQRLSNFMLWRSSYAELYFSPTLWPDFSAGELEEIVSWFQDRDRRYGGTG